MFDEPRTVRARAVSVTRGDMADFVFAVPGWDGLEIRRFHCRLDGISTPRPRRAELKAGTASRDALAGFVLGEGVVVDLELVGQGGPIVSVRASIDGIDIAGELLKKDLATPLVVDKRGKRTAVQPAAGTTE
jgi:endonuclease YncB( thermonuclease family)